jgi:hypothetical protein
LSAILLVTNKDGYSTESLGTSTLEFASIRRPFATTDGTLGIVIILVAVVAVSILVLHQFGLGFTLGHLFHASIKEIVFALPKPSFWIRLEISFNATLELVDGFRFEIGIDTGELVDQG